MDTHILDQLPIYYLILVYWVI